MAEESRFRFLWGNYHPHIIIQNNLESMSRHPDIDWNDIDEMIKVSRNNKASCYHSKSDLKKDIERGRLMFKKEYSDRIFNAIRELSEEYDEMFKELREVDYISLSDLELYELLKRVYYKWSRMVSYFRFNQAEGSHYLIEKAKEYFSPNELSVLMLPSEFDAITFELMDWQKLIKGDCSDEALLDHAYKHSWIVMGHFSYEEVLDTLRERYNYDGVNLKEKDFEKEKEELKGKQKRILDKKPEVRELIELIDKVAFSRMWIKSYWAGTDLYLIPLFEEIAKRVEISAEDIWMNYLLDEVRELLMEGKNLDEKEISKRKQCFVGYWKEGSINYYSGEEAEKVAERELGPLYKVEITNKIKGVSANPGKVKGIVRILEVNNVLRARELRRNFEKGEILVTQMTQPNIMDIASKAGGIITDEGGMLSHAAIISRELRVPCIVGTSSATQILKDGDLVEVDADKGVVKKIK